MAITTSQKIQLSEASPVFGGAKQEQSLVQGLLQKMVLRFRFTEAAAMTLHTRPVRLPHKPSLR